LFYAGMSMFSTRNGLYEKARKSFKISDGIKLFTYSYYKQHRVAVQVCSKFGFTYSVIIQSFGCERAVLLSSAVGILCTNLL
jgi:hypothetical protein